MKLKPLFNRVLVEVVKEEAGMTKSGIVLPDNADKKKQSKGVVVAIGDGRLNDKGERQALSVKIGDKVLFKEPWSDESKIEEDGKKFFLVDEEEILATILEN